VKPRHTDPGQLSFGYFFPTGQTDHIYSDEAAQNTPPLNKEVFVGMARAAEQAGFDSIFSADTWSGHQRAAERGGHHSPKYHAPLLAMAIFAVTEHIGVITTMHTTHHKPAHVARMGATLDAFSGGRWGWNIVTGFGQPEAELFGNQSMGEHDERYLIAAEFVEIVKALWTEEEPIDFEGAYYQVKGRIKAPRPAQNPYPLLVSAGASEAGVRFASTYADLLVAAGNTVEKLQEVDARLDGLLQQNGRVGQVATSPFTITIVRDGDGEAEEEYERLTRSVNYEATYELTADIMPGVESVRALFANMTHEEAGLAWGAGRGILKFLGTTEQVAQQILDLKSQTQISNVLVNFPLWNVPEVLSFRKVLDLLREAGVWTPPAERDYAW
jgi:dimethylsulfone monooxygenase